MMSSGLKFSLAIGKDCLKDAEIRFLKENSPPALFALLIFVVETSCPCG
jgi:hypothetical protein